MKKHDSKKIKVKDSPTLVRDSFSKAVISTDRNNYAQAKSRKKGLLEREETIKQLRTAIEEIKIEQAKLIKLIGDITNK